MNVAPPSVLRHWPGQTYARDPGLTLFQKVLLATDGTVTELLSLHTGKPIVAHKLEQTLGTGRALHSGGVSLEIPEGSKVLRRVVVLEPVGGGHRVFAESEFAFDRFSANIQHGLLETEEPIGLLWRLERLEMFREILSRQLERSADIAASLGVPDDTPICSRTYSISHLGSVLGLITEKFATLSYR